MDGQDDAMKSAMELFAARLAKRDVERPITDHRTVEGHVRQCGVISVLAIGLHFQAALGVICSG
jgi:hypothetical protein